MVVPTLRRQWIPGVATALLVLGATVASAQNFSNESHFQLPAEPAAWINSVPISTEAIKGKAAFLWFYEEDCPTCRGKWPALIEMSKTFEGKPIVFIAVNSGNSRPAVEQYIRGVRVPWPTIVDPTREFERLAGVGEISLQNIHQAKMISADGRVTNADWSDPAASVVKALGDAKWLVEPSEVPPLLRNAWLAIEFNNYAAAGPTIKIALASNKAEVKQAAEKLDAAVQEKIAKQATAAEQAAGAGNKWQAYKIYQQMTTQFAGFTLPAAVPTEAKTLAADPEVMKQATAAKALDTAKRLLGSSSSGTRRSAGVRLKKLVTEYPDTEAALEAQQLLTQLGNS